MLDRELFTAYADQDDQEAFTVLVDRHLPLIYGLARRRVRDLQLAEEVCQTTLCVFARAAKQQQNIVSIPAWLYRVTERQASLALRGEHRRLAREQEAAMREAIDRESDGMSEELASALREALAKLSGKERSLLFLRYYDGHTAEEIGELYGIGARAAQKRVERAVGRLRTLVSRRGLALPSAMLGAQLLAANAMEVPAGLAATAAQTAMSQATLPAISAPWWTSMGSAGWGLPIAGLSLCALLAIPLVLQRNHLLALVGLDAVNPNNPAIDATPAGGSRQLPQLSRAPATGLAIDDIEGIYQLDQDLRESALGRLTDYLKTQDDQAYLSDLFSRWTALESSRNANAIAALLESTTDDQAKRQQLLGSLISMPLTAWAQHDLQQALTWAKAIPRASSAERPAFESMLAFLAKRDLDQAYQWLRQRSYHRDSAFAILADVIGDADVAASLDWLQALPDDGEQPLQGSVTLTQAAGRTKSGVWRAVLPRLYQQDRTAVCAWLEALPASQHTTEAIAAVVSEWAAEDPQAALTWIQTLADLDERSAAQRSAASTWARHDPQQALHWVMALDDPNKWSLAEEIFQTWSAQGHWGGVPDAPRAWLADWRTVPVAASLFSMAAETLPLGDLLDWAQELPANANRAAVTQQAFYRLGLTDPHQAIAALGSLLHEAERADAIRWLGLGWIVSGEKQGFDAWKRSLDPTSKEASAAQLAEIDLIAALRPELATRQVLAMPPTVQRDPLLAAVIERTMRRSQSHADKARALTEEIQDSVLKQHLAKAIADTKQTMKSEGNRVHLKEFEPFAFKSQPLRILLGQLETLSSIPPL